MLKRILSGAVGIALIVVVIVFGSSFPIIIDIFISLVCAVAVGEFSNATKTLKLFQISMPSIIFAFVYPMMLNFDTGHIILYAYTVVMLSMTVFNHKKITFIITLSLSAIIMMKNMDETHSSFYFVLALAMPWLADAGAYFTGTFLGKHKLCPEISPKKTVEGVIGGVVVCVLAICAVGFVFSEWIFNGTVTVNYGNLILLSLIGSIFSVMGDLSFSLVKRVFKIKDYGTLIPGHGGVLDRFDSVVFVSPFLLIMITYLPVIIV